MNSQSARIPASKQTTGEKPRTKSKIFFSFITPDLRARRYRQITLRSTHVDSAAEGTRYLPPPARGGKISGSGGCWGGMLKDACHKKWRFNPLWTESWSL